MSDKNFEVGITVGLKDKASAGVKKLSSAFRRSLQPSVKKTGFRFDALRGQVLSAGKSLLKFGADTIVTVVKQLAQLGMAIVAVGALMTEEIARRGVNAAASFEYYITRAATMTGKTGDALKETVTQLSDFGIKMAKISMKKPEEIAQSFYDLMSAGLNVRELMQTFPVALALAEGAGSDLHTSTELLTATTRAFGLQMKDATRVGNVLAATLSNTRATVERLSISMPYAATAAKLAKVSLEDTAAALGLVMDRGVEASRAGTGLRAMFAKLIKPTSEGVRALKKYGLTVKDIDPRVVGFRKSLETLRDVGIDYADTLSIFGLRQAAIAQILIDNVDAHTALSKKITGTNRAFELQQGLMDTLHAQWEAFKGDIQMILITIGRQLLPVAREMLGALREFAAWLVQSGAAKQFGDALAILARSFVLLVMSMASKGELQSFFQNAVAAVTNFATVIKELVSGDMVQGWIAQIRAMVEELAETFRTQGFPAMLAQMGQMIWVKFLEIFEFLRAYINAWLTEVFGENWIKVAKMMSDIFHAIGAVFTKEFGENMVAAVNALLPKVLWLIKVFVYLFAKAPGWTLMALGTILFADKIYGLVVAVKALVATGLFGWIGRAVLGLGKLGARLLGFGGGSGGGLTPPQLRLPGFGAPSVMPPMPYIPEFRRQQLPGGGIRQASLESGAAGGNTYITVQGNAQLDREWQRDMKQVALRTAQSTAYV